MIPTSREGIHIGPGILIIEKADFRLDMQIMFTNRAIGAPYTVDDLIRMQFEVYGITAIDTNNITLTWRQYVGKKRPIGEQYIPTFQMTKPMRVLAIADGSGLDDMIRAELGKGSSPTIGGTGPAGGAAASNSTE